MEVRKEIEEIFKAGVESVLPDKLMEKHLKLSENILTVSGIEYPLHNFEHVYIVAVGKAAALMASAAESILGDNIYDGHVLTKYGHTCHLEKLSLTEAGHPFPDENGVNGTLHILEIARAATANDLVICLISGGASALMADFPASATLDELIILNKLLVESGADIQEINSVRKHLSKIKGGQLAREIFPATVVSLILSDVIGDPLDVIASGPTAPDKSTFKTALEVLKKYSLEKQIPNVFLQYLHRGLNGLEPETPKSDDIIFSKVRNVVIGNNRIALESAQNKAQEFGYRSFIVSSGISGDYVDAALFILKSIDNYSKKNSTNQPLCLLFGGEPTVKITGGRAGLGGRNQHLALYLANKLEKDRKISILCAGTDGTDGPTDVAGAVVDELTCEKAIINYINPLKYLRIFDSYSFFKVVGGHVKTGSTMTNVMDVIIVIIQSQ
ncbi:MAG: DUF4147 domain-containing protein [Paludibacter sp.]|nr:DUF4147 domain-containing protein [Paludibacter sp.]